MTKAFGEGGKTGNDKGRGKGLVAALVDELAGGEEDGGASHEGEDEGVDP